MVVPTLAILMGCSSTGDPINNRKPPIVEPRKTPKPNPDPSALQSAKENKNAATLLCGWEGDFKASVAWFDGKAEHSIDTYPNVGTRTFQIPITVSGGQEVWIRCRPTLDMHDKLHYYRWCSIDWNGRTLDASPMQEFDTARCKARIPWD